MLSTVPLADIILIFREYFIEISRHLTKYAFFKTFIELVKCLQVYLYIFYFFYFLSTCVTSADLRHEGKVEDLIELLMLFHKSSEKISNFRLSFGSGYPKSEMFYLFSGYEFLFQYLPQSISSKANFIHFLQLF